jgi:hypothetical protein
MGFEPTAAPFDFEGADIVYVYEGKIVRIEGYTDTRAARWSPG